MKKRLSTNHKPALQSGDCRTQYLGSCLVSCRKPQWW